MAEIFLTPTEYDKIKAEYDRMKRVDRQDIIKAISEARDHGDLSENAEYAAAKEKQVFIENKIARYEGILATARIIEENSGENLSIRIGSRVTLLDKNDGETVEYLLTSAADLGIYDIATISSASQVGKAIIGKSVGDIIEIPVPNGKLEYEIISHR